MIININKKVKYRTALHECMHAVKKSDSTHMGDFLYLLLRLDVNS